MKEDYFKTGAIEQKAMEFLQAVKPLRDRHSWVLKPESLTLLVLDMQSYFMEDISHAYIPAAKAIIPKIKHLQDMFLEQGLPVIQTRHINTPDNAGQMKIWWRDLISEDNPLSELIPDLSGKGKDITVLQKSRYDAFYDTNLQTILEEKGITQLLITGVMTHLCCETTARSAFMRGFDVFFGIDTTATYNSRFHLATLLNLSHGFAVPILEKEILDSLDISLPQGALSPFAGPPRGQGISPPRGRGVTGTIINSRLNRSFDPTFSAHTRGQALSGFAAGTIINSRLNRSFDRTFSKVRPPAGETKIAIIGGGPAGIAAGVQLKRYGFEPVLFEKGELGGLLKNANLVENYPGFPGGIPGPELVERLKAQVEAHGITVKYERVERLECREIDKKKKMIVGAGSSSYEADVVVIACGTEPKIFEPAESLPPALREKVFYDVYPLIGEKGKRIVIIGAGDAAFDYALNLSRNNEAFILNRTNRIKALPLLIDRVEKSDRIGYVEHAPVIKIEKGNKKGLIVTYASEEGDKQIEADYLLCALGRVPRLDFLPTPPPWGTPPLEGNSKNYATKKLRVPPTHSHLERVSIQESMDRGRLYFAGDVKNGNFRQAAIAAGNGIETAMRIYEDYGVET